LMAHRSMANFDKIFIGFVRLILSFSLA